MKIDGGCHCGYITYKAEADPERTTIFTRPPKATNRNSSPSVLGLYANVLRLPRRCRSGLAHNCAG